MVVITKRFKTYVSLKKIHCFFKEDAFFLKELELPSPQEKFIIS
jgi:hypothetical protein